MPHLEDCDVVLLDNRGTGLSSPVAAGRSSMDDMVRDVLAVLDDAGLESAHVHGTSMGGMIAQHLALEHPERVRSLVLSATIAGRDAEQAAVAHARRDGPAAGPGRDVACGPVVAPLLYADHTRLGAPAAWSDDLNIRRSERDRRAARPSASSPPSSRHDTRDRLHELADIPVTVVHGDLDVLVPACPTAAPWPRASRGARFVLLEGAPTS